MDVAVQGEVHAEIGEQRQDIAGSMGKVSIAELPARYREQSVVEREDPQRPRVADGFELDVVGYALLHEGTPVHLRPREFQLLATLAANPGRAFTRPQLIDLRGATGGTSIRGPSMSTSTGCGRRSRPSLDGRPTW